MKPSSNRKSVLATRQTSLELADAARFGVPLHLHPFKLARRLCLDYDI
jgi:hypothetical protein